MARRAFEISLLVLSAFISAGCSSPLDQDVPTNADAKGRITVRVAEDPPYPATGKRSEAEVRRILLRAAAKEGRMAKLQREVGIQMLLQQLFDNTHYGPAFDARFESKLNSDGQPLAPSPRFVQLVRATFVRADGAGQELENKSASALAAERIWTQNGGNPTTDGWTVDKVTISGIGSTPIYENLLLPLVFQDYSTDPSDPDIYAEMIDVPGLIDPWNADPDGDGTPDHPDWTNSIITDEHEFQTWVASPAAIFGTPGFGLFGYVHWSFTIVINVGTDKASTDVETIEASYEWKNSTSTDQYSTLMTTNGQYYQLWAPAQ